MKRLSPMVAGLAALLWAMPVAAASPTREYAPLPDLIEDTASCGYLVDVTFPVNQEYALSFYDNAGNLTRIQTTGHLVVTFTNPANDKSVTANISGPNRLDIRNGTFDSFGRGGGPLPNFTGLVLFAGRTGDHGVHGHLFLDVCAALA